MHSKTTFNQAEVASNLLDVAKSDQQQQAGNNQDKSTSQPQHMGLMGYAGNIYLRAQEQRTNLAVLLRDLWW